MINTEDNKEINVMQLPQEFINQIPGLFAIVDLDSKFISANPTTVQWCGYNSLDTMVGTTYGDLKCEASKMHAGFMEQDLLTIQRNKPLKIFGRFCYFGNEWKILFGEKYLLKNIDKKPIAIVLHFTEVSNCNIFDFSRLFNLLDPNITNPQQQSGYILEENYSHIPITPKQSACLFFLLHGKTAKETAKILNLSPRTVESHLVNIRNQLGCLSKSDLIEKSRELGYMNIIPQILVEKN